VRLQLSVGWASPENDLVYSAYLSLSAMPTDSLKMVGKVNCFKLFPMRHLGISYKSGQRKNVAHPTSDSNRTGRKLEQAGGFKHKRA